MEEKITCQREFRNIGVDKKKFLGELKRLDVKEELRGLTEEEKC